jgi:HK97 family phage major capsid protein
MPTVDAPEGGANQAQTRLIELRSTLEKFDNELLELGTKLTLTDDEEERYQDVLAEREPVKTEYDKLEGRLARSEEIQKQTYRQLKGLPEIRRPVEEMYGRDVRTLNFREARDGALRILGDKEQNYTLSPHQQDLLDKTVRVDTDIARRIIVTENDHYRSAFHKLMTRDNAILTADEHTAMLRYDEYRAQSEGSTTGGGFAVPVFIDPSVILTDQETDNPFLRIARIETVTTNAWKGVSAAGVVWSFDAEASAVSDDSITVAQPTVNVNMARGFIPYSIEVGQDWPGFQAEMGRLLGEGYDELLINKFTNGTGTNEPRGLLTALDANTNDEVVTVTDGGFFVDDLYKVWKSLPQKYRRRASWMMSVDFNNKIRAFGAANVFHAYTVNLEAGAAERLFNSPVYENPYFPDFTGTTGAANYLVVGDFSNYLIARRSGMSVELIPHLFDVTNNRPTGSRGWFAYARIGGNSVNDIGFRLLQNQ